MRILLFAVTLTALCLAGCGTSCEELADWTLEFSRAGSSHEGADGVLVRATGGDLVLAIHDEGDIQLGDKTLNGPHIARISRDGELLRVGPTPEVGGFYVFRLDADAAGNTYVVTGTQTDMTLTSYDSNFEYRWQYKAQGFAYQIAFDGDDLGRHVFAASDSSGQDRRLYFVDEKGTLVWMRQLVDETIAVARIVGFINGEVYAFGSSGSGPMRYRYSLADGSLIEAMPIAMGPSFFGDGFVVDDKGGFVVAGYASDGSSAAIVTRYDANAAQLWQRRIELRGFVGPVISDTGDVLGQTSYGDKNPTYRLLVLNGASGATKSEKTMCSHLNLIGADANQYFGIGLIGSESIGIARFTL